MITRGARAIARAGVALHLGLAGALLAAPGAGAPETPGDLREVRIGYFGPVDPDHPVGGALFQGATLAIEAANAAGGYGGLPFRLVADWDASPWTGGARGVVRMVYEEQVWAVLGGIDGTSTHLAEQVVAKARLPLVDPASTDRTVNAASVPWIFSCMPADRALMAALGDALLADPEREPFSVISATDHDSRTMAGELLGFLESRRRGPHRHLEFRPGSPRIPELAQQVAESRAEAVVVLAGASDSAALVRALRSARGDLALFGGPALGRRAFLEQAGPAAEGVLLPLTREESAQAAEFADRFAARWNAAPDDAAFHAYDAARLLVAAIQRGGLDRAGIRDALAALSPWSGVSGVIRWDEIGRNARRARLGTIRDGRVQPVRGGNARGAAR